MDLVGRMKKVGLIKWSALNSRRTGLEKLGHASMSHALKPGVELLLSNKAI